MTNFLYKNDLPADLKLIGDLAIDTETMGLKQHRDRLCVIQLSTGDNNAHLVQFEQNSYKAPNLKKLLSDRKRVKIFHFARFDVATIEQYLELSLTNIFCTKIASKLVRTYTDSHGLKELCRELLGIVISKQQQSSYWGSAELSKEQVEYAAGDVLYLHQLREKLTEMLIKEKRFDLAQKCFEFIPTRASLDLEGFENTDIFAYAG